MLKNKLLQITLSIYNAISASCDAISQQRQATIHDEKDRVHRELPMCVILGKEILQWNCTASSNICVFCHPLESSTVRTSLPMPTNIHSLYAFHHSPCWLIPATATYTRHKYLQRRREPWSFPSEKSDHVDKSNYPRFVSGNSVTRIQTFIFLITEGAFIHLLLSDISHEYVEHSRCPPKLR